MENWSRECLRKAELTADFIAGRVELELGFKLFLERQGHGQLLPSWALVQSSGGRFLRGTGRLSVHSAHASFPLSGDSGCARVRSTLIINPNRFRGLQNSFETTCIFWFNIGRNRNDIFKDSNFLRDSVVLDDIKTPRETMIAVVVHSRLTLHLRRASLRYSWLWLDHVPAELASNDQN